MKRLWAAGAAVVGLVTFGFGIVHADGPIYSGVMKWNNNETTRIVCHVLNTGTAPINVTIELRSEGNNHIGGPETFTNVQPGYAVSEDPGPHVDFPRNVYCKVTSNRNTWVGTLEVQDISTSESQNLQTTAIQLFHHQ